MEQVTYADTMPREAMRKLQLTRLRTLLARVATASSFYSKLFAEVGFNATSVQSLDDLTKLPLTTKTHLRDSYPLGMLAVPRIELVRVHASSGTAGKPTVVAYAREDIAIWAEVMARSMRMSGITADDVVHNCAGYGLFTGGLGIALGAETIGAMTVPVSVGYTTRQLMLMEDLGATVLCGTPSYALVLAEAAAQHGIDLRARMRLRIGIFGAETWTDAMRRQIEARFGIEAFDLYGMSEVIGPGIAVECSAHEGLHIHEDHFFPEIVDPDSGEPLPAGSEGELVLTTLTKHAMPLIRYRTRDRARLITERCSCGRTLVRMSRVRGRTDDMLIVRGVNVFPSQIEAALLQVSGLAPHYLIVVDRGQGGAAERLEIRLEPTDDVYRGGAHAVREVEAQALDRLRQTLGVKVDVRMVEPRQLERSEGKAVRVVDRRTM